MLSQYRTYIFIKNNILFNVLDIDKKIKNFKKIYNHLFAAIELAGEL